MEGRHSELGKGYVKDKDELDKDFGHTSRKGSMSARKVARRELGKDFQRKNELDRDFVCTPRGRGFQRGGELGNGFVKKNK